MNLKKKLFVKAFTFDIIRIEVGRSGHKVLRQ